MTKSTDWVIIGRFGRAHGLKGNIIVHSFTEPPDRIQQYLPWHAYIKRQWEPINIKQMVLNTKHILVQVDGYDTVEQVSELTNIDIAIDRSKLPNLATGEYYWYELVGMQVINLAKERFGEVSQVMSTGSNDVLVVQGEKRQHLIPYLLDQYVISIDKDKRIITVDWDIDF